MSSESRKLSEARRVLARGMLPMNQSWANIVNAESSERRRGPGARAAAAPARAVAAGPSSGNMRERNGRVEIYTTQPMIRASGETVRGAWVGAIFPQGDYGGPYSDWMDFKKSPFYGQYLSDMDDLDKAREAYRKWQAEQAAAARGRARSRSRSGSRGRGRGRSRSRGRGRGRSRSRGGGTRRAGRR